MNPFLTPRWVGAFAALMLWTPASDSFGQRTGSKSTNYALTTIPTVPEAIVKQVALFVHADPEFFTLDDLRRYGGNIKIIKEGERLENMKYFSLGREVEIVDDMPSCVVDVALLSLIHI